MKSKNFRQLLTISGITIGMVLLFQNCGRVNFSQMGSSQLMTGTDTANGTPDSPTNPPGGQVTGTDNPTPTPTPPTTSSNPTPTPTPPTTTTSNPTPTPPTCKKPPTNSCDDGSCDDSSSDGGGLCYLADGNGESDRIGASMSQLVQVLDVAHAIPRDVCMSANACNVLINDYLNKTGGNLDGVPDSTAMTSQQYTVFVDKSRSLCAHNPNVQHLSDAEITTDLSNLAGLHQ